MPALSNRFALEYAPPHLVTLKFEGDLLSEDIDAVFERIVPWVAKQPFWLFEIDISSLGQANPDARRLAAERIGNTPPYSMALFGGSLAQRAIATLFLKVSELFSGNRDVATKFVKDGATARAWLLDEERRRGARAR